MNYKLKLACISDTHMWGMPLAALPPADVLVHAGDGTYRGTIQEVTTLAKELGKHLKDSRHHDGYQAIIYVAGNHDWLFKKEPALARQIMKDHGIITLINESFTYMGIKFWGSPVTSPFGHWAFMEESHERYLLWETIPEDTDVVITHGPPKYILDTVKRWGGKMEIHQHVGCEHLAERLRIVKPSLSLFGHIHEGYGQIKVGDTLFVNASVMDDSYSVVNKPIVVTI